MRYKKAKQMGFVLAAVLSLSVLLSGCRTLEDIVAESNTESVSGTVVSSTTINLDEYDGEVDITKGGSYTLTGTLENGQIVVDAEGDIVELVLDNATINSDAMVAIYVKNAEDVTITLADGTTNTITTSGTYSKESVDAAIFVKCDLTLEGTGTLNITAADGDAVYSKGELYVNDGIYVIQTADGATEVKSGSDDFGNMGGGMGGHGGWGNKGGKTSSNSSTDGTTTTDNTSTSDTTIASADTTTDSTSDSDVTTTGGMPGGMTPPSGDSNGQMPSGDFDPSQLPSGDSSDSSQMPSMPSGDSSQMPSMPDSSFDSNQSQDSSNSDSSSDSTTTDTDADYDDDSDTSLKGFKAKEGITIAGGTFTFDTEDDAIHSNGYLTITGGTFTIASGDDGMHAEEDLTISDATIDITKCYEGIEGLTITVNSGDINIVSNDDGFNAADPSSTSMMMMASSNCLITINGGTITVDASGDGIDSNGDLVVNGGTILVLGPANGGNAAVDYGDGATFTVNGGELLALGYSSMAENADSSSTQAVFLQTLSDTSSGTITITDADGNVLITADDDKEFNSVLYTSSQLSVGSTYTITVGSSTTEVTLSSTVTGSTGSGFGGFMKH